MPESHPSAELAGVFRRPFTEQIAFFRRKLDKLVATARWDDMLAEAHDDGFMVAGAAKAELLTDLAAAVDKAIAEGTGLDAFRKDFRAIVRRNGWTGWTGEGSVKGEAWRVKTIYRTNAYTSYAAGRRAQLEEGGFALWVYRHGGSLEPRPEHLGWDGVALPPGDPFWATHYPPSDWGCSCYVVGASSEKAARRLGARSFARPANWNRIDPKTGAPVGIGRGWDYAPGASVSRTVQALAGKVRHWDHRVAKEFMAELPAARADALAEAYRALPSTADDARRYAQRVLDPPPIDQEPGAPGPPPARTLGLARTDQVASARELLGEDVAGSDFAVDRFAIRHIAEEHGSAETEVPRGQRPVTAADYALLPQLISEADQVEQAGTSKTTGAPLLRLVWDRGFELWEAVFELRRQKRSLALTTLLIRPGRQP